MKSFLFLLFTILFLVSCGIAKPLQYKPKKIDNHPLKLAVFLDGTSNNARTYTNVFKLYNLVSLQNNPNISAQYQRGVGNGADILGKIMGSGIKREVCKAYLYLAENYQYQRNDEIYIFGFSRGAYTSRVLAGFIFTAGIIEIEKIPKEKRLKYIKKVFDAHKGKNKTLQQRRDAVYEITQQKINPAVYKIAFMGLWDTVSAIGSPKYDEEYYSPNNGYVDQLCNVKKVSQALSLNDSRSAIFTPVMLSHSGLTVNCKKVNPNDIANEVWFFGAHSDVGGGYTNTHISGVSLNWMLKELKGYNLLPINSSVYENRLDITNNPSPGIAKLLFSNKNRKLSRLASLNGYKKDKLKIHRSVLDRLEISLKSFEINLIKIFSECFEKNDKGGYTYKKESNCFRIID